MTNNDEIQNTPKWIYEVLWIGAAIMLTFAIEYVCFSQNKETVKYIITYDSGKIFFRQDEVISMLFLFVSFCIYYFRNLRLRFIERLPATILCSTGLGFVGFAICQLIWFSAFEFVTDESGVKQYPSIFNKNAIVTSSLPGTNAAILTQFSLIIAAMAVLLFLVYAFAKRHEHIMISKPINPLQKD